MDFTGNRSRWAVIFGLLLLAAVPRVMMAWRIDVLCPDATIYVQQAEALQSGRLQTSTLDIHRWLYPAILALLNAAGLSWETAGELWGILVSSLVVVPLYLWVHSRYPQRHYGLIACLLYATHPEFIEWSVELIRDATFWLLFACSVAFAFHGKQPRWKSGCALAVLAGLFRIEGFLLVLVLVWQRSRALSISLIALLIGLGFLFPAGPLGSVAAMDFVALLQLNQLPAFCLAILSGMHPLFFGLWVVALCTMATQGRRQSDFDGLGSATYGLLVLAMWIHMSRVGSLEPRYALVLVILALPLMAQGLTSLCERRKHPQVAMTLLLLAIAVMGWADAWTTRYDSRQARAKLGSWLRNSYGSELQIAGHDDLERMVGHYSGSWQTTLPAKFDSKLLLAAQANRNVLLLSEKSAKPNQIGQWVKAAVEVGYRELPCPKEIADRYPGICILTCFPAQRRLRVPVPIVATRPSVDR